MTLKSLLAALGVAALVAVTIPVAAQADGMHHGMKRNMMMHRHMMHHHPMMMHRHMMMHHHHMM